MIWRGEYEVSDMTARDWAHSICIECWNKRNKDRQVDPQGDVANTDTCCYCHGEAQGLYIHDDPSVVHPVRTPP